MIEKNAVLCVPWNYTVKEKENERLFIDKDAGSWFRANLTGAHILQTLLDGHRSIAEVLSVLAEEYGVAAEVLEPEVIPFLDDAVVHGICQQVDTAEAPVRPVPRQEDDRCHMAQVWIHPHARCNLHCPYCYNYEDASPAKEGSLEVRDLEAFVEHIRVSQNGKPSLNVVISGGEPMLWFSKTFEIVKYLKESGTCERISMLSNGTVGSEQEWRQMLPLIDNVQFSLDGSCPEINDRLRSEGSFEKTVRSIKLIQEIKADFKVSLRFTVSPDNLSDMDSFVKTACDLRVSSLSFNRVISHGRATHVQHEQGIATFIDRVNKGMRCAMVTYLKLKSIGAADATVLTPGDLDPGSHLVWQYRQRKGCGAGKYHCLIAETGNVYPCVSLQSTEFMFGNLRRDTPAEILATSERWANEVSVEHTSFCGGCDFRYFCGGSCRATNWCLTGDVKGVDKERIDEITGTCSWRVAIEERMWKTPCYEVRRRLGKTLSFPKKA